MPVTDQAVAAVRRLLTEDPAEGQRIFREMDNDDDRAGFLLLLTMAFHDAAQRRFGGGTRTDIERWLADLAERAKPESDFDFEVAERLLLWVFNRATRDEIEPQADLVCETVLLVAIYQELNLNAEETEAFLRAARKDAEIVQGMK